MGGTDGFKIPTPNGQNEKEKKNKKMFPNLILRAITRRTPALEERILTEIEEQQSTRIRNITNNLRVSHKLL